uniref:Uncharacterized protein n=1 Tax=Aquila chrysaetos chrysaetos TaxID=223781 RepID=A0A663DQ20_AQUCH
MPICSVMCRQEAEREDRHLSGLEPSGQAWHSERQASPRFPSPTSPGNTYHSAKSCGEESVVATMRAPWEGGLDQVVRTIFSIWESTRCTLSASFPTTVRFPTRSSSPKFLENDCAQKSSKPSETKYRTAQASLSRLPEAKPWYAESKNGNRNRRCKEEQC